MHQMRRRAGGQRKGLSPVRHAGVPPGSALRQRRAALSPGGAPQRGSQPRGRAVRGHGMYAAARGHQRAGGLARQRRHRLVRLRAGRAGAAVCAGAVAAAAAAVGLLAGCSGGHGAPSVAPCVVDGGAGEKNRRCREKSLSFSPQVRYDKEKDGEGGEHTWHRRKKRRTAPTPPWCC